MTNNPNQSRDDLMHADRLAELSNLIEDLRASVLLGLISGIRNAASEVTPAAIRAGVSSDRETTLSWLADGIAKQVAHGATLEERTALAYVVSAMQAIVEEETGS